MPKSIKSVDKNEKRAKPPSGIGLKPRRHKTEQPPRSNREEDCYHIAPGALKLFFIFNWIEFNESRNLESRPGSQKDSDDLQALVESFGYTVKVFNNFTLTDMNKKLDSIRQEIQSCTEKISIMMMVVMSHGDGKDVDSFLTADGQSMPIQSVQNYFSNTNCPKLKGIPTIFLAHFCRNIDSEPSTQVTTQIEPMCGLYGAFRGLVGPKLTTYGPHLSDCLAIAQDTSPNENYIYRSPRNLPVDVSGINPNLPCDEMIHDFGNVEQDSMDFEDEDCDIGKGSTVSESHLKRSKKNDIVTETLVGPLRNTLLKNVRTTDEVLFEIMSDESSATSIENSNLTDYLNERLSNSVHSEPKPEEVDEAKICMVREGKIPAVPYNRSISEEDWEDMYVLFACEPKFYTYRDPEKGSLMIQSLCKVWKEHAATKHLGKMFFLLQVEMKFRGEKMKDAFPLSCFLPDERKKLFNTCYVADAPLMLNQGPT